MDWETVPSGRAEVQHLYVSPTDHVETRLVRFAPEAGTQGAPELLGREVLVVEGDFDADGEELREGDFHRSVGASVTGQTSSGCTLFTIRQDGASAGTGEAPDVGSLDTAWTIHANEGDWEDLTQGVRVKPLVRDDEHHFRLEVVHMEPGAALQMDPEDSTEEIFVLRGTCRCQDQHMRAGDHARVEHEMGNDLVGDELETDLVDGKVGEPKHEGNGKAAHLVEGVDLIHTVGGCELVRVARVERQTMQ